MGENPDNTAGSLNSAPAAFTAGIAAWADGDAAAARQHFDRAVAMDRRAIGDESYEVPGVSAPQSAFQVIQRCYLRTEAPSADLSAAMDFVAESAWAEQLASIQTYVDVVVVALMALRAGDTALWEKIADELPRAAAAIPRFAIGFPRLLATFAFLVENAGASAAADQWFAATRDRLAEGPNCMCPVEGCTMGVGEWLAEYGR